MFGEPAGRLVVARHLAGPDSVVEPGPARHLAVVESFGATQIAEAARPPVDGAHQHDAVDQLLGQAGAGGEILVERRRPVVPADR
ncbi:hypothetical protein LUX57_07725 [Actinomadura madurae]|nr:hypothetical protein [Actinomadura madurae]MCP9965045.1 hypothetical protein [Actinomadura madurae]